MSFLVFLDSKMKGPGRDVMLAARQRTYAGADLLRCQQTMPGKTIRIFGVPDWLFSQLDTDPGSTH